MKDRQKMRYLRRCLRHLERGHSLLERAGFTVACDVKDCLIRIRTAIRELQDSRKIS